MGFFDFLKKAGVVKAGGQTWKGDASQRPVDDPTDHIDSGNDNPSMDISDNPPSDDSGSSD
jgi:hypothetical protein